MIFSFHPIDLSECPRCYRILHRSVLSSHLRKCRG